MRERRADGPRYIVHALLDLARRRAKAAGLEFSLCADDIHIPDTCPLLGIPLARAKGGSPGPGSPSVDRKDPRRGYTPDNVWVISHRANRLKSDATPLELAHFALACVAWLPAE